MFKALLLSIVSSVAAPPSWDMNARATPSDAVVLVSSQYLFYLCTGTSNRVSSVAAPPSWDMKACATSSDALVGEPAHQVSVFVLFVLVKQVN